MQNKCEVCGKEDIMTAVGSCTVGPCSFNYCQACNIVGAEPLFCLEYDKTVVTYNNVDDMYYQHGKPISNEFLVNGVKIIFENRTALAKHCRAV